MLNTHINYNQAIDVYIYDQDIDGLVNTCIQY